MKLGHISALIGAATVALGIAAFPSSAHALTYSWDINLSVNGYTATGQIYTDTNTPNQVLQSSNFTSYTINLINGSTSDTLTGTIAGSLGTAGLKINSTGSSLDLPNLGSFQAVDISNSNGSRLYFGYPNASGSIPNLLITLAGVGSSGTGTTSDLAGSNTFATATPVPFEIPGGATIPSIGALLALGAIRGVRKSIASNTRIANPVCETVS